MFSEMVPPVVALPAGTKIVRIHRIDRAPIFFGPSAGTPPGNRFDAPSGEFRVLYAAQRLEGAFVETILRRPKDRILRPAFVEERAYSELRLERPLRLAKLHGEGLQAFGTDAGELGIDDHSLSRALAAAIHAAWSDLDGIAYRSRYNNGEICHAVFDRAGASSLVPIRTERFDAGGETVGRLMALHRAAFDLSPPVPERLTRARRQSSGLSSE